jgi:hypothetical protein
MSVYFAPKKNRSAAAGKTPADKQSDAPAACSLSFSNESRPGAWKVAMGILAGPVAQEVSAKADSQEAGAEADKSRLDFIPRN